jgi:antirestriction protein ArdC
MRLSRPRQFPIRIGLALASLAKMGAAFLCAIAEIANEHTDRDTTAYIQSWISKLEEDNRLIVQAATSVQRAVDCILGKSFEEKSETTENAGDEAASGGTVFFQRTQTNILLPAST